MGNIIAIAGEMGSGKDTFAQPFLDAGWQKAALADNLKNMAQIVFGISPWHTDTQEGKAAKFIFPVQISIQTIYKIVNYMMITHSAAFKDVEVMDKLESLLKQAEVAPKELRTTREILQYVGTDICRHLVFTYHVDVLAKKIMSNDRNWVVTDCRFGNERVLLKVAEAILVRVKRPSLGDAGSAGNHASENSLGADGEYDWVVDNTGTIEDLHQKARQILGVIESGRVK